MSLYFGGHITVPQNADLLRYSCSSSINSIINFWLVISIFGYSYPQISILYIYIYIYIHTHTHTLYHIIIQYLKIGLFIHSFIY